MRPTLTGSNIRIQVAIGFLAKLRGLIHLKLPYPYGLLFKNSNSVHTCFMRYNLDIFFLNKDGVILKIYSNVKPWRFRSFKNATHFLEVPSSWNNQLTKGDKINIF